MTYKDPIKEKIYYIILDNMEENEFLDLKMHFEDVGIGSILFIKIMAFIEIYYDIEIEECYFVDVEYKNIEDFIEKMAECVRTHKRNKEDK